MMDKAVLRKRMREERLRLTEREAEELSLAAQRHILASRQWHDALSVGLYLAVRRETATGLLLGNAWERGKQVLLPRTSPAEAGVMEFLPHGKGGALAKNRFGIPEPVPDDHGPLTDSERAPSLLIVPGLAFDGKGHRLGSGGGYYDRLFAKPSLRGVVRIGLAYAFQMVESLPAEAWDVPMHAVATEEGLLWI